MCAYVCMLYQRPVVSDSVLAFWYDNMFHAPTVYFLPRIGSSQNDRDKSLDVLEDLTALRLVIASRPLRWAKIEVFVCVQYIQPLHI